MNIMVTLILPRYHLLTDLTTLLDIMKMYVFIPFQILVHEIGHNLNMDHDFVNGDPNQKRFSSTGAACTDIDSYMDYYKNLNKWSPCSVEDITQYYNQVGPTKHSTTCITLLGNDNQNNSSIDINNSSHNTGEDHNKGNRTRNTDSNTNQL